MDALFSDRISDVPRSFIREILKVAIDPSVISFAGGLPNRELFPVEQLQAASARVFESAGRDALQYSSSEGFLPLRQWISGRYLARQGLEVPVDNILITTGSQQGLDLLGKTLVNLGDGLVIEEPGYLGAIQAFSLYRPSWSPVPVSEDGMNVEALQSAMAAKRPKLIYTVPNFQNPGGFTYPDANRRAVARTVEGSSTLLIEDDPYGDLRFSGQPQSSFRRYLPDNTILLGSFSKIIAPGLRVGWLVAPDTLMQKLIVAKQASDLHTNVLSQRIIQRFLLDNDIDAHIARITEVYGRQRDAMVESISTHLPADIDFTSPSGGMFIWVTLPDNLSATRLFERAIEQKVAFVPGKPFYIDTASTSTLRLNFSCADGPTIDVGIRRLGAALNGLANE